MVEGNPPSEVPAIQTIVALGDSTTAGTPGFLSPLEAPPNGQGDFESQFAFWLERARPEWRVLNRGVNGERSDQIRARFDRDVLNVGLKPGPTSPGDVAPAFRPAPPDLVIIIAGVNDVYQGRTAESVQANLLWMYERARAAGIPVVAGSIVPYNTATADQNARMRAVNAWIARTARERPLMAFCDTRAAVAAAGNPDRLASSPDGLHPSPAGYRAMAGALVEVVAQLLDRSGV